jgi:hypothetical protein
MILTVKRPFVGQGFNMPAPGTLIEVSNEVGAYLVGIDVADPYETKVLPLPDIKKKIEPSASSPVARQPRRKTRKNSKKSARKS